jgi:hypothetical protein
LDGLTRDEQQTLIQRARLEFQSDCEAERDIRDAARLDLAFVAGEEQWAEGVKKSREDEGRPALTFSKLHIYIQSLANEARMNKPQPKVNPIGGGATTDVANVLNGIIRHVQYRSHADVAWDTALDYSAGGSFGFVRMLTERAIAKSMDQDVRISAVLDPFSIYGVLMPACRGTKCTHAFVVRSIPREEYKRKYGTKQEPVDFDSAEWKEAGDWIDAKNVRIAEYWELAEETKTLRTVQSPDGTTAGIYTDDPRYREDMPFVMGEDGEPLECEEEVSTVTTRNIDGCRVLPGTETTWVGDSIPIFAVLGRQMIIDGEVRLFSLVRFVRDAQKLINLYKSTIAEKMALANRVPYLGYKGQFKDPKWEDANRVNYPYLEVEPVTINGNLAPLPIRQELEEQIAALSAAVAQEIDDLKSGMGIYDASLGARGNETSGRGINARKQQSNITNFHFSDNLERAEWDLCLALLKIIPKIYDRPGRQTRIVGEDQQHSVVVLNQPYIDPETGAQRHYQLDVGEYDVVVVTGPSYATARLEGADTLQQFFQAAPQTVPILGDLWVGSLDYPWAREGARRLKAAAPQNIVQEDQPQGGGPPIPPQVLQQVQAIQQQLQQTQAFAQSLHEQIETKAPELASKERMHAADLDFKREELQATIGIQTAALGSKEAIAQLQQEVAAIQHEREMTRQQEAQSSDQQHQAGMQQGAQQHASDQQQQAQGHEAQQATQAQDATASLPQAA